MAPEVSMATAAGFVTLLLGKPLPPHTAVAMACSLKGVLTGVPMDDEMLWAAKRNHIKHILLDRYVHSIHRLTTALWCLFSAKSIVANSRLLTMVPCSATRPATSDFLQQCADPEKASISLHYLDDASGLLPCVAALGDPNECLPDLVAEEFELSTAGEVDGKEGEIDYVEVDSGAAAATTTTAESQP
jgi:hypothetical protein